LHHIFQGVARSELPTIFILSKQLACDSICLVGIPSLYCLPHKQLGELTFTSLFTAEDNDPDSSMLSSPSNEAERDSDGDLYNEDEDQDLFPSSDRPSTPKNNHLNATAPGELSPPQSQSTSQRIETGPDDTVEMGGMGNDGDVYSNVNGVDGAGEQNGKQYVPGSGYKTRKANEDYQRAAETLVDLDFSLREFGDLFDDRAILQQQQQEQQQEQQQQIEIGQRQSQ